MVNNSFGGVTLARSPNYEPNYHNTLAKYMARCGLTDEEMAKELGVGIRTFYRWKKTYPEFCQALKENKGFVDALVEDSLLKKAIGYEIEEVEVTASKDGKNSRIKKTKKWIHDTTAAIFWLKNRQPDRWRDTQNISHEGEITSTKKIDLSYMSDEELKDELQKYAASPIADDK